MGMDFCNNVDGETAQSTKVDGGEAAVTLRKGAWTPEEDEILKEYVKKNGEGDWGSVPNKCGLARCGKSCRLRWANRLNPNLKKTAFSEDEEKIIVDLHAKLGNKWSRMAAQLPGRTDNEIKNFWHARTSRHKRAGLPIYPPEVQKDAAAYHLLQEHHNVLNPNATSFSFSSLLSSSYGQERQKSYHYSLENPMHTDANDTNPFPQFNFSNANNGLLVSSVPTQIIPSLPASNSAGIDSHGGFNPGAVALGSPYEHLSFVKNSNSDFFSSQTLGLGTAALSYSSGVGNGLNYSSNSAEIDSHGGFNPSVVTLGSPYEHLSLVHNSNSDFFSSQTLGSRTAASSYSNGVDNGLNLAKPPSSYSSSSAGIDSHGGFNPCAVALGSPYEHFSFVHNSNSDFFSSQKLDPGRAASSYNDVDNGLNMAEPTSSYNSNFAGIDSHGGFNPSDVALRSPYEHFSFVHNSNSDFFPSQAVGSETATSSYSSGVDNGLNMAKPPSSYNGNSVGIDLHGGLNPSVVAFGSPYEHLSFVHNSNSDFISSQTLGSGTAASSYSGVDNGLNMAEPPSSYSSNSARIDSHGCLNPSAVALGSPYEHFSFVQNSNSDIFSSQTLRSGTAASSYSGVDNGLNMVEPPSSYSSNFAGIDSHGGFNPSAVPYEYFPSVLNSNSDFFPSQTVCSETAASSYSCRVDVGLNMTELPSSYNSNSDRIDLHGGFNPIAVALESPCEHFSFLHNLNSELFSSQTLGLETAASTYSSQLILT